MDHLASSRDMTTDTTMPLIVPINSLPDELLVNILLQVLLVSFPCIDYLRRLMRVSRGWKKLIEGNHALWSIVHGLVDTTKSVRMAIQKSGNVPLIIRSDAPAKFEPADLGTNSSADKLVNLHELCGQIHRWAECSTVLWFGVPWISYPYLYTLLERPAPRLRSFTLLTAPHIPGGSARPRLVRPLVPIDLFRGHAPLLTELYLTSIQIPWESSVLAGLNRLSIHGIDSEVSCSCRSLLNMLQNFTSLTYLSLKKIIILDEHEAVNEDAPVTLPDLKDIEISGLGASVSILLLTRMITPKCKNLKLSLGHANDSAFTDPTIEVFECSAFSSVLPEVQWIEIGISSTLSIEGRQDGADGRVVLALDLGEYNHIGVIREFRAFGRKVSSHTMPGRLVYHEGAWPRIAVIDYLHDWPGITELYLHTLQPESLLKALVTPNPEAERGILFPNLLSLRLYDWSDIKAVLECLQSRIIEMPSSQTLSPRDVTFEGIRREEADSEEMDQIEAMVEKNGGLLTIRGIVERSMPSTYVRIQRAR